MAYPSRPEPMNATTHHPKVKVSLTLGEPYFLAGEYISGKLEMDCKADQGLGINVIMIELFAIQELTSRDHSARSTFIHTRRLFQGPGLPPSNAVQAHPMPGDPPLPPHYHQAKKGHSTFLFRLPLPVTSPSSISFGSGLASVKYEVRASVGVSWKGERQLVTDKKDAEVVEAYDEERIGQEEPEATVVGENGKIWCQARVIGGILVAGESACIELQVKNHSVKKNTGLFITLNRSLNLANTPAGEKPLQINDTVITVPFRGSEYVIPPGVEGVASLVFDVPKRTKGVRGGLLLGDESEAKDKRPKTTQGLFEVCCILSVKMPMGLGSKDIILEIPVTVVHPSALPELPPPDQYLNPYYDLQQPYQPPHIAPSTPTPFLPHSHTPYTPYPALPLSPVPGADLSGAYVDPNQNLVWLPTVPFATPTPQPYHYYPDPSHEYYNKLQPQYGTEVPDMLGVHMYGTDVPPRPLSAGPFSSTAAALLSPALPGLPMSTTIPGSLTSITGPTGSGEIHALPPLPGSTMHRSPSTVSRYGGIGMATGGVDTDINGEEGTGQRASRIARNLRVTSQAQGRGRSVSPVGGRRYPITGGGASHPVLPPLNTSFHGSPQMLKTPLHSPRPVLSPKQSFTKVTQVPSDGGAMVSKSVPKSERVEELERLADEVGSKTKDLSGDWEVPPPDENHIEPPPVPTVTDKARFNLASKAKAARILDDYFSSVPPTNQSTLAGASVGGKANGNLVTPPIGRHQRSRADARVRSGSRSRSRTPPTPATPTLTAVATPRKSHANANTGYSTKALKSKTGNSKTSLLGIELGRKDSESGLDALERKLLAEVGTRKVVDEKRPNVWSVLGADPGLGADGRAMSGQIQSRRPSQGQSISPIAASSSSGDKVGKPSPISIPRRDSDRDPLNDSAISSLTLPDCGPGDMNDFNIRMDTLRMLELDDAERQNMDRERDSDEKTHIGGPGKKKSRKSASRGTLKDGVGGDEAGEGKKKDKDKEKEKEKKSRKKGRSSATKGRVAAWLGSVEAEPPLDDVIAPSPSPGPTTSDLDDPEPKIETKTKTKTITKEVDINANTAITGLKSEPSKPELTPAPDPRSSGFVPIGTLKRDIYQRTLVPKDSPLASTSPTEDAKRITDIWSHRDTVKDSSGAPSNGTMLLGETLKNPWQSVVGKSRIPTLLPPSKTDPEVKYDVRSARGGKGGRVTAVAAIWATGVVGATKPVLASPSSSSAGTKPVIKVPAKPPLPFSVPRLPVPISTSSSSSSTSGDGRRVTSTRPGVKVASAPLPAVISSSRAKPMLSTTASLARPSGSGSGSSGGNNVLPVKIPPTISELPPDAKVGGRTPSDITVKAGQRGLGAGSAANNLRAVTSPGSGTKSNAPSTAGEHLAFGQARLRDLIKKYQGQAS